MRIMRIFTSSRRKTDQERDLAVEEGKAAKQAIDKQFNALFDLMDETLQSVRQIEYKPAKKTGRKRNARNND